MQGKFFKTIAVGEKRGFQYRRDLELNTALTKAMTIFKHFGEIMEKYWLRLGKKLGTWNCCLFKSGSYSPIETGR